jgi:hypothetical protein
MAIFSQEKGKIEIDTKGHTRSEIFGAWLIKDGKVITLAFFSLIILLTQQNIWYTFIPETLLLPQFFTTIFGYFKK